MLREKETLIIASAGVLDLPEVETVSRSLGRST